MASNLTSRFIGQACLRPLFLVAATSISLALQLQNGDAKNANARVTLNIGELTINDALRVRMLNVGKIGGIKLGTCPAGTIGCWDVTPIVLSSNSADSRQARNNEALFTTGDTAALLDDGTVTSRAFSEIAELFNGKTN